VIVPEINAGQLVMKIRADFLVDARGVNKVTGKPFLIAEIETAINTALQELG